MPSHGSPCDHFNLHRVACIGGCVFGGIDEWSCAWMAFFGEGMSRWVLVAFAEVPIIFTKGEWYMVRWGSTNKHQKGTCLK